MINLDVSKEYSQILKAYLTKFSLEPVDIAFFIKTNKEVIEGLLTTERGAVLKTLEAIAQVFGLRYFQFGDPKFPIPKVSQLPEKTKERIKYRKEFGPSIATTYNSYDLNDKILIILSEYNINDEFLPSEIGEKVNHKFELDLPNFKQITDRFKKGFDGILEKTGKTKPTAGRRGRPEEYYRLIKEVQNDK